MILEMGEPSLHIIIVKSCTCKSTALYQHYMHCIFPVLEVELNFCLMESRIIMWHSLANQIPVSMKRLTSSVVFVEFANASITFTIKPLTLSIKSIVHPKMKVLSSFTCFHAHFTCLYDSIL